MRIEQAPEKRIEQHASWIAINPVIGCPYNCDYCFLGPDNLRPKRPENLRSPDQTMQDLLDSKYYAPDIPVAIGTYTDMFATPKNQEYVRKWLDVWRDAELENPLVFITKGEIPDDIAETMGDLHASGLPIVAFLSISGLGREIEKGVKHKELIQNIGRLARYHVPVVHYWRPLMPQNSTPEVMDHVHSLVAGRTTSSFVGGLRLTEAMKPQIPNWPDILDIHSEDLDSIWDQDGYDRVSEFRTNNPDHPIYEATSCTMANATHTPEYNGVYGTDICAESNCPAEQRTICSAERPIPTKKIHDTLRRLNYQGEFKINTDDRVIELNTPLEVDELTNIMHSTGMRVITPYVTEGHYQWGFHGTRRSVFISKEIPLAEKPKQLLGLPIDRLQELQEEYKKKSGIVVGEEQHFLQLEMNLVGDGANLCGITDPDAIDLKPAEHNIPRWQTICTTRILFNIFNTLSCMDKKIDQKFIDQVASYAPSPDGWRTDLSDLIRWVTSEDTLDTSDTNAEADDLDYDTFLADLAGCVIYGYKETNLGNISLTMGQLATRLQDIIDSHTEK